MSQDKKMKRGVQQALYKYLPGSWANFTQSGGSITYAVHVDNWNSIQLTGINNKRLLRNINQQVQEFIHYSDEGEAAVVDFADKIDENNYDILTPKVSDAIAAIQTSVKPWVFVCSSCGHVRQYYSYDEFKQKEHKPCEICGQHMNQLQLVRFCKCGYADGIYVPKCSVSNHGTKFMTRRGSGFDFVCSKCGKKAPLPFYCPDCHQKLDIKPATDSSIYIPYTLSLIDLLDKRKDTFIDNETGANGEKVVIAQYLNLIPQAQYEKVVLDGEIVRDDKYEEDLKAEADRFREIGMNESFISQYMEAKRRSNPSNLIFDAIAKVETGISIIASEELIPLAEAILEYDELKNSKVKLTIEEAANDAEIINDGIRPDYRMIAEQLGFSNIQLCSAIPIITSAYGFTRKERKGTGVKLRGFPREMEKHNVYAARLETEGVLFELDRAKIINWLIKNELIDCMDGPKSESDYDLKLWFLDNIRTSRITTFNGIDDSDKFGEITKAVYTLIHSVSHALINEAAEICGLDKSSLSEYIFPNIPATFIYCSNSQGYNMGALYSAFQTQLAKWLLHAQEISKKCIFDPICISHEKACAGCLFLNEVSCQHFNKDLDRSYLCGYYSAETQKKITGYWEG